jgi:hypothetical protein
VPDVRKNVKVFLASPSDLADERKEAKAVVDEFNKQFADALGYQVELVGWEETLSGPGRPQELINRDLDQCELFVGMLWKRWGTPPGKDSIFFSGFEEEYETSFAKWRTQKKPHISLFFKSIDEEAKRDPGPQLAKVLEFQTRVTQQQEILHKAFSNLREFETRVRECITSYVLGLYKEERLRVAEQTQSPPTDKGQKAIGEEQPPATQTPLSAEGSQFLHDFLSRTDAEGDESKISNAEVARFRLLASVIAQPGNDDTVLGVHDANILYVDKGALKLSRKETTELFNCGLDHLKTENVPIWYWLHKTDFVGRDILPFYTVFRGPNKRKASTLEIMRKLRLQISADNPPSRKDLASIWLGSNAAEEVRTAALSYFADCGVDSDLPSIRAEYDRGDYRTASTAMDAIVRINLRQSRSRAIAVLFELQPESVNQKLVAEVFAHAKALDEPILLQAAEHRSPAIRLEGVRELRRRSKLGTELAEKLLDDTDPDVRFEAILALTHAGRTFSADEARRVLVKPVIAGLFSLAAGQDPRGNELFKRWQSQTWHAMPLVQLRAIVDASTMVDREPYFVIAQREFAKHSDKLRADVDDQFRTYFADGLREIADKIGRDRYERLLTLGDSIRRQLMRDALNVLCARGEVEDLPRVRKASADGFVGYTEKDIDYMRKIGEWEDISLIISLVERPDYSAGLLLGSGNDANYRAAAEAVRVLAKDRIDEVLRIDMPSRMQELLIRMTSDQAFRSLSDATIDRLLVSSSDTVRKIAALKVVRAFASKRLQAVLARYLALERRYYNVMHWLDLGASFPRMAAVKVATQEIETIR